MNFRTLAAFLFVLSGWAEVGAAARDEPKPKEPPKDVVNAVELELVISGVGKGGYRVEVKPAHRGCRFEKIVRTIEAEPGQPAKLKPIRFNARSFSADRDCAFAITITDAEGESATYKRSIRLESPTEEVPRPKVSKSFSLRTTTVAKNKKKPR